MSLDLQRMSGCYIEKTININDSRNAQRTLQFPVQMIYLVSAGKTIESYTLQNWLQKFKSDWNELHCVILDSAFIHINV